MAKADHDGAKRKKLTGPDLTKGIALDELPDGGMLVGYAGDEQILLVRRGKEVFAVGAQCTHYQGPLAEGLLVGDTVRCPWHHACFDLRNGEAVGAPALSPVPCWNVEHTGDRLFVREKMVRQRARETRSQQHPHNVVIVGAGAAGQAAAEALRREGFEG